jgi:predicted DNA-binding ribbon-helix-helix protein
LENGAPRAKALVNIPPPKRGKSLVLKRNVKVGERKSSVGLEDAFWVALKDIAAAQRTPVSHLLATIDSERRKHHQANLSSTIRLFVLDYYRQQNERGQGVSFLGTAADAST